MIQRPQRSTLFPYTTLFRSNETSVTRSLITGNARSGVTVIVSVDWKSTRLNSSHEWISYAVFCLKKKMTPIPPTIRATTENIQTASMISRLDVFILITSPGSVTATFSFFFNDTATTETYTLSLHDALPISGRSGRRWRFRRPPAPRAHRGPGRSEEHTSELQSRVDLVCRLLLEKKK